MHLKHIKISGFKSFADSQDLSVMAGLTGIVGPNGCGKSNLLESLRWVMGASSARAMRGQAMDDLIFSGSSGRAARELAEVSLVLDNTQRKAPPAFNDSDALEIIRRIKRSAGSSFTINGRPARAKDIRLIFADASTGANSPSLVRQGQISELIAARPENRRRILEEAAGIAGLNTRRHEAELKLKNAETNLERCSDIESEILRQLASLKRQAAKAEKYRTLSEELQALELYMSTMTWTEKAETYAQAKTEWDAAKAANQAAEQEETRAETLRLEKSTALAPLKQAASIAGAKLGQVRIEHVKIETQLNASTDAQAAQKREEASLRENLTALTEQISEYSSQLATHQAWLADNPQIDETIFKTKLEEIHQTKRRAQDKAFDAELEANAIRDKIAKIAAEKEAQHAQTKMFQARYDKAKQRLDEIENQKSRLPDLQSLITQSAELQEKCTTQAHKLEALQSETITLKTQVKDKEAELHSAQNEAAEAKSKLQGAKAELKSVSDILRAASQEYASPIIDHIKVTDGYETALSNVLGDDLQASMDTSQPLHWRDGADTNQNLPDEVKKLSEFVNAPQQLRRILSQCGVVDDVETGERLSRNLLQGQRLVTKAGHLWRWDGFTRFPDAPQKTAETLRLINRKDELEVAVQMGETAANAHSNKVQKIKAELDVVVTQLRTTQDAIESAEKAEFETRTQSERTKLAIESAETKHRDFAEHIARATQEFDEAKDALPQTQAASDAYDTEAMQVKLETLRTDLTTLRQEERAAELKESEWVRAYSSLKSDIDTHKQNADKTEIRLEAAKSRLARTQKDLSTVREKIALADKTPADLQQKFEALTVEMQKLETERQSAQDVLGRAEAEHLKASTAKKEAAVEAIRTRENVTKSHLVFENAERLLTETIEAFELKFEIHPKNIDQQKIQSLRESYEWPELMADLKLTQMRLTEARERLGGVNMDAQRDADELSVRAETHAEERADLETAIAKLRQAIGELNDQGRDRLTKAFDMVNEHFKTLFTRLFGGGQAELKLVNADDPLAAGLEIFAQPPGKKLATLALMSGGEQALTATALIFAVFLSQPSPICVLDEVDAPLDDANVARFCDLLDTMKSETDTRFLVITHNPVTMARMDRLFGVTMREKGVSRLVSVDLQTANKMVA